MAKEMPPLSADRIDAWFGVAPRHVAMARDRLLHWVANADHVTGRVASGTAIYEEQAIFVLRLAGILIDLRGRFPGPTDLTPQEIAAGGFAAEHREQCRMKLVNAIAALRARLTEDELLWLELRRHEQGHPSLNGYMPKLDDGPRWDRWTSKILDGRELSIGEVVDRCAVLESTYGGFDGVAVFIARKVFQHVGAVQLATIPLMAGLPI
jgi:hypothetical protein